jgi:hypothetical protein
MVSHTPHAAMRSRSNPLTHIRAVSMQQGRARVGRPGELKWLLLRAEGRVAAGVVQVAVVACADALAWRPGVWKDPLALGVPRQSREAQPRAEPAAKRTLFSRPFIKGMREFINAKFACMQGMHSMSRGNSASGLQERNRLRTVSGRGVSIARTVRGAQVRASDPLAARRARTAANDGVGDVDGVRLAGLDREVVGHAAHHAQHGRLKAVHVEAEAPAGRVGVVLVGACAAAQARLSWSRRRRPGRG